MRTCTTATSFTADGAGNAAACPGLRRIGIDEISYRKGQRYLLCAVEHATGRLVCCGRSVRRWWRYCSVPFNIADGQ